MDLLLTDVDRCKATVEPKIADHHGIMASFELQVPKQTSIERVVWHFKRAAWQNLKGEFRQTKWDRLHQGTVDDAVGYFLDSLPVNPRPGVEINVSLGSLLAVWLAGWWAGELACGWLVGRVAGWVHCGVDWLDDSLNGDWLHALAPCPGHSTTQTFHPRKREAYGPVSNTSWGWSPRPCHLFECCEAQVFGLGDFQAQPS